MQWIFCVYLFVCFFKAGKYKQNGNGRACHSINLEKEEISLLR